MLPKIFEHWLLYLQYAMVITILNIADIKPQAEEFPVGVFTNLGPDDYVNHHYPSQNHSQIEAMGVNGVIQFITQDNRLDLQRYTNLIGFNTHYETDQIAKYASGYYSRWEAEENTVPLSANYPGIKHEFGELGGNDCWKSGAIVPSHIGEYLITGPDYYQNREHRFWPYSGGDITYNVKFRLKIDGNTTENINVCKLQVVYYAPNGNYSVLKEQTFKANELSNNYVDKVLDYTIPETIGSYAFPANHASPEGDGFPERDDTYNGRQGVRFNVIWLGNRELYVDYIEVYDDRIGKDLRPEFRGEVAYNCSTYAANYPQTQWPNLKYWYGLDEPQTIDNFDPYRIVDSILNVNGFPRLITTYYPEWHGYRDNEIDLKRFVEQVQPARVMYYYYPFYYEEDDSQMLEFQRVVMQQPWEHSFGIGDWYFVAQAFGTDPPLEKYNYWIKPSIWQLKASVNLALAHGAKGIFFWNYYSQTLGVDTLLDAIVDTNYNPTTLYYGIRDSISSRLNGILGTTLLKLNYLGQYAKRTPSTSPYDPIITWDFLTIQDNDSYYNWHAGLLNDKTYSDNEYFLLVNLNTEASKTAELLITNNSGYNNLRVRSVEDQSLDITVCIHKMLKLLCQIKPYKLVMESYIKLHRW